MALLGKSSYLKTVELFLEHWGEANARLGDEGPLVVRMDDGSTINLPALRLRRDEMKSSLLELQAKITEHTLALEILNLAKRAILFRARSLLLLIRENHRDHPDFATLPKLPETSHARKAFVGSLRAYASIWKKINEAAADGEPLHLPGRYPVADFEEEMTNLEVVWIDSDTSALVLSVAEEEREASLLSIPRILIQYKQKIRGSFPADSKLVKSLPTLYLAPGYSPKAVHATGVWDLKKEMGKITWEASTETEPFRYEVRYSPGNRYNEEVESTIAVVNRTAPTLWRTLEGLREKGRTALFRVYVVLLSGNETASETIAIINGADDE
jgi:hypothetical protein